MLLLLLLLLSVLFLSSSSVLSSFSFSSSSFSRCLATGACFYHARLILLHKFQQLFCRLPFSLTQPSLGDLVVLIFPSNFSTIDHDPCNWLVSLIFFYYYYCYFSIIILISPPASIAPSFRPLLQLAYQNAWQRCYSC